MTTKLGITLADWMKPVGPLNQVLHQQARLVLLNLFFQGGLAWLSSSHGISFRLGLRK
jgi:hypothetical protein